MAVAGRRRRRELDQPPGREARDFREQGQPFLEHTAEHVVSGVVGDDLGARFERQVRRFGQHEVERHFGGSSISRIPSRTCLMPPMNDRIGPELSYSSVFDLSVKSGKP